MATSAGWGAVLWINGLRALNDRCRFEQALLFNPDSMRKGKKGKPLLSDARTEQMRACTALWAKSSSKASLSPALVALSALRKPPAVSASYFYLLPGGPE